MKTLIVLFALFCANQANSQSDSICELIISASFDSSSSIILKKIDSVDLKGDHHLFIIEKVFIYLSIDSILSGNYVGNNIIIETEPLVINLDNNRSKLKKERFEERIRKLPHIYYLQKDLNGNYIICPEIIEILKA